MELICAPVPRLALTTLLETDDLELGLAAVRSGNALVARIANFYTATAAGQMAERLLLHTDLDHYELAPEIGKIGTPYYDSFGNQDLERRYWENAPAWNEKLREAYRPWMSPVDRLHVELDEMLPHGARILRDANGNAAFAGLVRIFGEGAGADPHTDRLEVDAPKGRLSFTPVEQLAFNVHLRPAAIGGELAIWSWKPTPLEYERLRIPGWYGLDRSKLPAPTATIAPRIGDLIVFSSHNVHSVLPSRQSPRVTASFFVVFAPNGAAAMYS